MAGAVAQGWSGFALKTCKGHSVALTAAAWARRRGLLLSLQDLTNPGRALIHAALFAAHVPMINDVELNSPQFTPAANAEWLPRLAGLFEPFPQADTSTPRLFGGTGLGLAISKRLARMLGGDIHATSRPGKGSVFTLTIDPGAMDGVSMIEHSPSLPIETNKPFDMEWGKKLQGRVLLVEDGKDNQRLIGLILEKRGLDVCLAENGRIALEKVDASVSAAAPFDLILMDMQMPEMDGYEATRHLRQDGWDGPIIALTAHAMAGDRQKCIDAGCNDYLTKPIDRPVFLATVARCLAETAAKTAEDASASQP